MLSVAITKVSLGAKLCKVVIAFMMHMISNFDVRVRMHAFARRDAVTRLALTTKLQVRNRSKLY
jgi:hypothetical protein